jgi:hypothetical protein
MSCLLHNDPRAERVRHLLGVRSDMQVAAALAEHNLVVDHGTIRKWRTELGIPASGKRNTKAEVSHEEAARWLRDYEAGYKAVDIARGTRWSPQVVRDVLREARARAQAGADAGGTATG